VEGSAVFFLITLLISIICLMLMTPLPPLNILVISMMVAGFGTLVEAASWRGFDNLFLPLGLSDLPVGPCREQPGRALFLRRAFSSSAFSPSSTSSPDRPEQTCRACLCHGGLSSCSR
jgi:hypothetical protein